MRMVTEAHLPPSRRYAGLVRYLPGRRRSLWRWSLFIGFIVLNEVRGAYVAVHVWQSLFG